MAPPPCNARGAAAFSVRAPGTRGARLTPRSRAAARPYARRSYGPTPPPRFPSRATPPAAVPQPRRRALAQAEACCTLARHLARAAPATALQRTTARRRALQCGDNAVPRLLLPPARAAPRCSSHPPCRRCCCRRRRSARMLQLLRSRSRYARCLPPLRRRLSPQHARRRRCGRGLLRSLQGASRSAATLSRRTRCSPSRSMAPSSASRLRLAAPRARRAAPRRLVVDAH